MSWLPHIKWYYWLIWAAVGFVMEMVAMFNKNLDDTLTQTTIRHTQGWMLAMVLGWLAWHVMVSYMGFWAGRHGR
jgi:hypothetical protein